MSLTKRGMLPCFLGVVNLLSCNVIAGYLNG